MRKIIIISKIIIVIAMFIFLGYAGARALTNWEKAGRPNISYPLMPHK